MASQDTEQEPGFEPGHRDGEKKEKRLSTSVFILFFFFKALQILEFKFKEKGSLITHLGSCC